MPRHREQFGINTAGSDLIRQQIEYRLKGVAELDQDIADYEANATGIYVNMKTYRDTTGKTLAKRARKRRKEVQGEIDALQAELARRASAETPGDGRLYPRNPRCTP